MEVCSTVGRDRGRMVVRVIRAQVDMVMVTMMWRLGESGDPEDSDAMPDKDSSDHSDELDIRGLSRRLKILDHL